MSSDGVWGLKELDGIIEQRTRGRCDSSFCAAFVLFFLLGGKNIVAEEKVRCEEWQDRGLLDWESGVARASPPCQ
jgi:hypothetical protein